ncbi:MAG: tetratricopeptide repeat protein [Gammaproteobacteria bacterium]|nr:tetratricopeptide repeat protein [Gammaproteobacteria bacterium]
MKKNLQIEQIQKIHREGHLAEAEEAYLALLQEDPHHVSALHFLGIVYAEEGKLEAAQACLEKAILIEPNAPALHLHLANILKARGLFNQAINLLEALVIRCPDFAAAFNNLGIVYFAQEKWQAAIAAYQNAIKLQADYADAYYNLGLAYAKSGKLSHAISAYEAVIALNAEHAGAQFQLASLLMRKNQYPAALKYLLSIELRHPFHFETQSNIATCYLKLGNLQEAEKYYLKALTIVPQDEQILFNVGVLHMQQGHIDQAIHFYLQAVAHQPGSFAAHNNLAVAYLAKKDVSQALLHFRKAESIAPENEAIRHTINILAQQTHLSASPLAYVRALFDSYADHYDAHLRENLHYQVPELLYEMIKNKEDVENAQWDILDLGCGTGLCGNLFKQCARSLIGVDLSEKMLAEASQKNIYDELIQMDVMSFLSDKKNIYDLVIAGDVLVYFGDLLPFFSALTGILKKEGYFVFNVEQDENVKDYRMTTAGRFVHSANYIKQLVQQNGLILLKHDEKILRLQDQMPVKGQLYLLQKAYVRF